MSFFGLSSSPLPRCFALSFLGLLAWAGALSAQTIKLVELEDKLSSAEREELIAHVKKAWQFYDQHFDMPQEVTLKIRLFSNWRDYLAYRESVVGPGFQAAGYYTRHNEESVTSKMWKNGKRQDYLEILIHEAMHHLMFLGFPQCPIWINEGFAEFYSNTKMSRSGKISFPFDRRWFRDVFTWKTHGQVPSIESFLRTSHREFTQFSARTYGTRSYGMAYTLTYYLMSSSENREILSESLEKAAKYRDVSVEDALDDNYPGGLSRLEHDWHRFIKRPKSVRDF